MSSKAKHTHENGSRVKFPPVTLHSETAEAVRRIKAEKQVTLGVAIDMLYFELKQLKAVAAANYAGDA